MAQGYCRAGMQPLAHQQPHTHTLTTAPAPVVTRARHVSAITRHGTPTCKQAIKEAGTGWTCAAPSVSNSCRVPIITLLPRSVTAALPPTGRCSGAEGPTTYDRLSVSQNSCDNGIYRK
jgi:hypothetical protein